MIPCPCCSQKMLMYAQKGRTYWYCPSCRQEMPDLLNVLMTAQQQRHRHQQLNRPLQMKRALAS